MNKRGQTDFLAKHLFDIIVIIFVFFALVYFISENANGKAIEKQVLAKEICLMTLSSKPETTITIEHDKNFIIEKNSNGFEIKTKDSQIQGYVYDCYGHFDIKNSENGLTQIKIT